MRTPKRHAALSRERLGVAQKAAHNWSIRAKIISVLSVPLVTLVVMWALATSVTIGPGLDLLAARNNLANVGLPVLDLVEQLQAERKASFLFAATGRRDAQPLTEQRGRTDTAIATFRERAALDAATELGNARLAELTRLLEAVPRLRAEIDRGDLDPVGALERYSVLVDANLLLSGALVSAADDDLARQARALLGISRAREVLSQEDALVVGSVTAAGALSPANQSLATQLIGAQRTLFAAAAPDLERSDQQALDALDASAPFTGLAALENQVMAGVAVDAEAWSEAYGQVNSQLLAFETSTAKAIIERSQPAAALIIGNIVVAGLLGLVTVLITTYASIRMARSLIRRLAGLRQAALELAVDRLPSVVGRLRRGEEVDVAAEAPPLPYGEDEIGQVGLAFNQLARTAINSAVDEANVRRGLNEVFLNIARRSQTLLHRQLSILDRMERRAENPEELEDLFRIDHLATRMRRHAEDLVILAGAAPGRGWRNPVPIVDVLRGAVSEVEDYARVSIRPMPEISLAGRCVGDLIHLLAELIENATSFSPPHTRVSIGGERVTNGFAVEIEDRGLGLPADRIAEINRRLAEPPDFDPASSAQLGLFVVARLAARHRVRVQLRSSPYGGITAVALLPDDLVLGSSGELESAPARREAVAALPAPGQRPEPEPSPTPYEPYEPVAMPEAGRAPEEAPRGPGAPNGRRQGTVYSTTGPIVGGPIVATPGRPLPDERDAIVPDDEDALPKRVRQARPSEAESEGATQPAASRSPEEVRAMMSSFQAGTERGRREMDDEERGAQ